MNLEPETPESFEPRVMVDSVDRRHNQEEIQQSDVEIIDRLADRLNEEAEDVLGYQDPI